jgi:hypothetical protein
MPKVYGSGKFLKDLDFIFDKEYNAYEIELNSPGEFMTLTLIINPLSTK